MWKTIAKTRAMTRLLTRTGSLTAALLSAALLSATPALADGRLGFLPLTDDRVVSGETAESWHLVQSQNVLPLETVLGIARREIGGGELLEVDLNERTGVYRLKMIKPNDSVVDVIVDGKSGRVLRVRGR